MFAAPTTWCMSSMVRSPNARAGRPLSWRRAGRFASGGVGSRPGKLVTPNSLLPRKHFAGYNQGVTFLQRTPEAHMDTTATLQAVQSLPLEDRLELLFQLWDQLLDEGWQPTLSEELKAELDRRWANYR